MSDILVTYKDYYPNSKCSQFDANALFYPPPHHLLLLMTHHEETQLKAFVYCSALTLGGRGWGDDESAKAPSQFKGC